MAEQSLSIGSSPADAAFEAYGRGEPGPRGPAPTIAGESLGSSETDQGQTFYMQRYGRQALGLTIPNMAGYQEPAMAGVEVKPFDASSPLPSRPDGVS